MRPTTPLAVENGVGKLAAKSAPNVSPGKREWRTPIPHFVPVQPQGWAGTFGFSAEFFEQIEKGMVKPAIQVVRRERSGR